MTRFPYEGPSAAGAGEGMVAIVRALHDAGLAVTLEDSRHIDRRKNNFLLDQKNNNHVQQFSTAAQTNDSMGKTCNDPMHLGKHVTSYQVAHCNVPSKFTECGSVIPSPHPVKDCPGGYRGCTPWPQCGSVCTPRLSRGTDAFIESLRKYPKTSPERSTSAELIHRLLTYTQGRNYTKSATHLKSKRTLRRSPEPTKDAKPSKNIQTYTRTQRSHVFNISTNTDRTGEKKAKSSIPLSPWPRRVVRKVNSAPSRSKDRRVEDRYEYLKTEMGEAGIIRRGCSAEVRYLPDVSRLMRDAVRHLYDEPATCPQMANRLSRHRRLHHRQDGQHQSSSESVNIEVQTSRQLLKDYPEFPTQDSFDSPGTSEETSPPRIMRCCFCNRLKPCSCRASTSSKKIRSYPPGIYDFPLVDDDFDDHPCSDGDMNKKIDEQVLTWLKNIPVYDTCSEEDKEFREEMAINLAGKLKRIKDDENFEEKAGDEIIIFLSIIPMWYPDNNDKESFKKQIGENLLNRLRALYYKFDKFNEEITNWVNELYLKPRDRRGKPIDRDIITNNIIKRLKPVALKRAFDDDEYKESLKTEIRNFLDHVPLEIEEDSRQNIVNKISDNLASKLALIPVSFYEPENLFERLVTDIVDDTSTFHKLDSFQKKNVVKTLAKKYKELKAQSVKDDDLRRRLKQELKENFAPLSKLILMKQIIKEIKSWIDNNIPELSNSYEERECQQIIHKFSRKILGVLSKSVHNDTRDQLIREVKKFLNSILDNKDIEMDIKSTNNLSEKLANVLMKMIQNSQKEGRRQPLRQFEKEIINWLSNIPEVSNTYENETIKKKVQKLAKELEELEIEDYEALKDEITEKIEELLNVALENEDTTMKEKTKYKLIDNLVKTLVKAKKIEKPKQVVDVGEQYENEIREWFTDIPELANFGKREKQKKIKKLAKNLVDLQQDGLDEDTIDNMTTEIKDWIDSAVEQENEDIDENLINQFVENLLNRLIKKANKNELNIESNSTEKSYKRGRTPKQEFEDKIFDWVKQISGQPDIVENKQTRSAVKKLVKDLDNLQSDGDDVDDEINNDTNKKISRFLNRLLETDESVIDTDTKNAVIQDLISKLIEAIENDNENNTGNTGNKPEKAISKRSKTNLMQVLAAEVSSTTLLSGEKRIKRGKSQSPIRKRRISLGSIRKPTSSSPTRKWNNNWYNMSKDKLETKNTLRNKKSDNYLDNDLKSKIKYENDLNKCFDSENTACKSEYNNIKHKILDILLDKVNINDCEAITLTESILGKIKNVYKGACKETPGKLLDLKDTVKEEIRNILNDAGINDALHEIEESISTVIGDEIIRPGLEKQIKGSVHEILPEFDDTEKIVGRSDIGRISMHVIVGQVEDGSKRQSLLSSSQRKSLSSIVDSLRKSMTDRQSISNPNEAYSQRQSISKPLIEEYQRKSVSSPQDAQRKSTSSPEYSVPTSAPEARRKSILVTTSNEDSGPRKSISYSPYHEIKRISAASAMTNEKGMATDYPAEATNDLDGTCNNNRRVSALSGIGADGKKMSVTSSGGIDNRRMSALSSGGTDGRQMSAMNSSGADGRRMSGINTGGTDNRRVSAMASESANDRRMSGINTGGTDSKRISAMASGSADNRRMSVINTEGANNRRMSVVTSGGTADRRMSAPGVDGLDGRRISTMSTAGPDTKRISVTSAGKQDSTRISTMSAAGPDASGLSAVSAGGQGARRLSAKSTGSPDTRRMSAVSSRGANDRRALAMNSGVIADMKRTSTISGADNRRISTMTTGGTDGRRISTMTARDMDNRRQSTMNSEGADDRRTSTMTSGGVAYRRISAMTSGATDNRRLSTMTSGGVDDRRASTITSGGADDRRTSTVSSRGTNNKRMSTISASGTDNRRASALTLDKRDRKSVISSNGADDKRMSMTSNIDPSKRISVMSKSMYVNDNVPRTSTVTQRQPMDIQNYQKQTKEVIKEIIVEKSNEDARLDELEESVNQVAEVISNIIYDDNLQPEEKTDNLVNEITPFIEQLPIQTNFSVKDLTNEVIERLPDPLVDIAGIMVPLDDEGNADKEVIQERAMQVVTDFINELTGDLTPRSKESVNRIIEGLSIVLGDIMVNSNLSVEEKQELMRNVIIQHLQEMGFAVDMPIEELSDVLICNLENAAFITSTPRASRVETFSPTCYNLSSIREEDNATKINEERYVNQLYDIILNWMNDLPILQNEIQDDNFKDAMIRELTGDIVDRQKYLQLNPDVKTTTEEELEHFKYQVFRWLNKTIDINDLSLIMANIEDLMDRIKRVPIFSLVKPLSQNLQNEISNWLDRMPPFRFLVLDRSSQQQMVKELADTIQSRLTKPNPDSNINSDIYQWLPNILNVTCTELNNMASLLKRTLKDKGLLEDNFGISKTYKRAADILYETINYWCQELPIYGGATPEEQERIENIKQNLASKLINKVGELNMNPEIFNDDFLYDDILMDEIDKLLSVVPRNPELEKYLPALVRDLILKIKDVKQKIRDELAGQTYKQQLRDAVVNSVHLSECVCAEEQASFEILKENVVDAFIYLYYVSDNEDEIRRFKRKINDEINRFCNEYLRRHPMANLDSKNLNQELYLALRKIPVPKDESMRCEVEQVRLKEVINDWIKELPMIEETSSELLQRNKMVSVLTKRLLEMEKEKQSNEYFDIDGNMLQEITKWLSKITLRPGHETEVLRMAERLVENIKITERYRSFDASKIAGNMSQDDCICTSRYVTPTLCTLSPEDQAHLQRIRERVRDRGLCFKDAFADCQIVDAGNQFDIQPWCSGTLSWDHPAPSVRQTASTQAEKYMSSQQSPYDFSPQIIVKEYIWDSTNSNVRDMRQPKSCSSPKPCISAQPSPCMPLRRSFVPRETYSSPRSSYITRQEDQDAKANPNTSQPCGSPKSSKRKCQPKTETCPRPDTITNEQPSSRKNSDISSEEREVRTIKPCRRPRMSRVTRKVRCERRGKWKSKTYDDDSEWSSIQFPEEPDFWEATDDHICKTPPDVEPFVKERERREEKVRCRCKERVVTSCRNRSQREQSCDDALKRSKNCDSANCPHPSYLYFK